MPELPEVENVKLGLTPLLEGATLLDVKIFCKDLRYKVAEDFAILTKGQEILALERRAKFLLFHLSGGKTIISHLGMSGIWRFENDVGISVRKKHDHIGFIIEGKRQIKGVFKERSKGKVKDQAKDLEKFQIFYNDPRRFGFLLLEDQDKVFDYFEGKDLGVEPLEKGLTRSYLLEKFYKKKQNLKAALLDQRIIAGLGNIYVCEILWRAGLSPYRESGTLVQENKEVLEALIKSTKYILKKAIKAGGSSLRDYKHIDGIKGSFQSNFSVYNREDKPCLRCKALIIRTRQNNRSTYYCPFCQK